MQRFMKLPSGRVLFRLAKLKLSFNTILPAFTLFHNQKRKKNAQNIENLQISQTKHSKLLFKS